MAELAGDREGARERALDPGRDADLAAFLRIGIAPGAFLDDLVTQVIERDLELVEDGADDVTFGQSEQEMFGVDLAAAEFASPPSGRLEDLLSMLAQTVRHACCSAAAAGASTSRPDRNGRAAIPGVGRLIGKSPCAAARALAEEVAAEEVVEQAAAPAEEGLQLRTRPLLPRQTPVIDVAELHGLPLAVADHLRSNGRRPDTTDVTQSVCHACLHADYPAPRTGVLSFQQTLAAAHCFSAIRGG